MYIGSWKLEDFLTFSCTTHAATSGKLTDADGLPNFRVYEDATDAAITTGSMPKLDDANTTGFYNKRVQITAASSFEKGKSYTIYKEGTVYGRKAAIEDHFQIEAEVDANVVSDKVGFNITTGTVNYVGTVNLLNDKTGFNVNTGTVNYVGTVNILNDKTGFNVTTGTVNYVGTVNILNDKTGFNVTTGTVNYVGTVNILNDKTGFALSSAGVDAILDEVVEGTLTMRQMMRIFLSRLAGEATGGSTTEIGFRDNADTKNRITMTVDVNGNRSSIVLDGS